MYEVDNKISVIDLSSIPPHRAYFGEVIYEPGGALGPRLQPDVQAVIVDRGSARISVNGREHILGPGGLICLWPGGLESFHFDTHAATTHRWVTLSFHEAGRLFGRGAATTPAPLIATETHEQRTVFDAGRRVQAGAAGGADPALIYLGLAYFTGVLAASPAAGRGKPVAPLHPAIASAMRMIQERFDQPLTLRDLAGAASVTPSHLVRLFRRHLQTTPMRALWDARVERGAELLRETGLSVSEIAYRVGFANPYHFSRLMRQHLGLSPSAWRKRAWSGGDQRE